MHTRQRVHAALAVIALMGTAIASQPALLSAQGALDRNLSDRGLDRREAPRAQPGLVPLAESTLDTLTYKWTLQPLFSASTDAHDAGARVQFKNTDRFGRTPWMVAARGVRRTVDGISHGRWLVEGDVEPSLPDVGKSKLGLIFSALHAQTVSVSQIDEVTAELDVQPDPNVEITFSGIAYYDWIKPEGGLTSKGAYFGTAVTFGIGNLEIVPEYDFPSSINDGDSYSIVASLIVHESKAKGRTVAVRGGWEKGDVFSLRLAFGVPKRRITPIERHTR